MAQKLRFRMPTLAHGSRLVNRVFTPVLANVDHQEDGVPMKELQFENGFSLVLTSSHMVYSKGDLIPVHAVQPGSIVDGKTIVAITNVTGHPANVVTLRQDIMVNGVCATWLVEEYMPVARFQFVWNMIKLFWLSCFRP